MTVEELPTVGAVSVSAKCVRWAKASVPDWSLAKWSESNAQKTPLSLVCSRATVQELCCFCREPICLRCGSEVEMGTKVYLCCPQCAEKESVNEDDEAAKAAEEEERLALLQDDKDQEEADAGRVHKKRRIANSKEEAKPSSKAKAKLLKDLKDSAAAVNFKSRQ